MLLNEDLEEVVTCTACNREAPVTYEIRPLDVERTPNRIVLCLCGQRLCSVKCFSLHRETWTAPVRRRWWRFGR